MGQTFSKLLFHIIFGTKDRMPYLAPTAPSPEGAKDPKAMCRGG